MIYIFYKIYFIYIYKREREREVHINKNLQNLRQDIEGHISKKSLLVFLRIILKYIYHILLYVFKSLN